MSRFLLSPFSFSPSWKQDLDLDLLFSPFPKGKENKLLSSLPFWVRKEIVEEGINLFVELPGFGEEDVSVDLEGNVLSILASSSENRKKEERSFQFKVPLKYKLEGIKAELKNGLLLITIPRHSPSELSSPKRRIL